MNLRSLKMLFVFVVALLVFALVYRQLAYTPAMLTNGKTVFKANKNGWCMYDFDHGFATDEERKVALEEARRTFAGWEIKDFHLTFVICDVSPHWLPRTLWPPTFFTLRETLCWTVGFDEQEARSYETFRESYMNGPELDRWLQKFDRTGR